MLDSDGGFERLTTDNSKNVHVMALHLETYSQYGAIGLDPERAMELARALRETAYAADAAAVAYNHMVDQVEHYQKLDAHYIALGRRVRHAATWLVLLAIFGALLWLR